mmetsp:Transcript_6386/g.7998  ORF Transcript_6386/g.7998 Transcript_6386/m.7998 type:complete len:215 (+) Transcript_6386:3342-3986(+)
MISLTSVVAIVSLCLTTACSVSNETDTSKIFSLLSKAFVIDALQAPHVMPEIERFVIIIWFFSDPLSTGFVEVTWTSNPQFSIVSTIVASLTPECVIDPSLVINDIDTFTTPSNFSIASVIDAEHDPQVIPRIETFVIYNDTPESLEMLFLINTASNPQSSIASLSSELLILFSSYVTLASSVIKDTDAFSTPILFVNPSVTDAVHAPHVIPDT